MKRIALALALATSLGACSSSPMDAPGSYSAYGGGTALGYGNGVDPRSIANATALPRAFGQLPPAAGPVINVLEKRFTNGVIQDVILAGDVQTGGENKITISVASRQPNNGDGSNPGMLWLTKADDHAIFQEITDQFPDVGMNMSQIVDRNAQGPFGYALGKRGNISCIYAWQWIEDRSGLNAVFFDLSTSDRPAVTVRVRLCKAGVRDTVLAGFVRQLVVNAGGYGGYGGGTTAAPAYYPGQQAAGGSDALTIAAGGGPGYTVGYRQAAVSQPNIIYASPAMYRAAQVRQVVRHRPHFAARRHVAVRQYAHRVHHRRIYRQTAQPYYGNTAALPQDGGQVAYQPAPNAQMPRYVPAQGNRAQGGNAGSYVAVPLPE